MRAAIVTESFLPHMNGVTGSVLQILRHLELQGHEARVYAPAAAGMPRQVGHARIEPIPSLPLPGYRTVRVGTSSAHRLSAAMARFEPDVVHLASPFALGWRGALAAARQGVPSVAAYQTDVAAYASRYGVALTTALAEAHIARLHRRATLTLAPSSPSEEQLARLGVDRVRRWGRGVDAERFHPDRRLPAWDLRGAGEVVVGYVGRLAPEKQVEDLAVLQDLPGVRLVIVGEGPSRPRLETLLPRATFLGHRSGEELAQVMASFDVFVHPGESETFGQTLQEAHASGVPVVATGRGGPCDLVRTGVDGWLYRPGELDDLRDRVRTLVADPSRRRAFGEAGRAAVERRSWAAVCDQLIGHFAEARELHRIDAGLRSPRTRRPELPVPAQRRGWRRYVAVGDSLTEGLCDPDRDGALRGWADRLALLLAAREPIDYANLAIRSKRVVDVCGPQLSRALELRPDLVSILIGANDLVKRRVAWDAMAAEIGQAVARIRATGADVLLVTPFLPGNAAAGLYARRFSAWASILASIAHRQGALLLDTDLFPQLAGRDNWGEDLVHLSSQGHRFLAYRAGAVLGVPLADELGVLDDALHTTPRTGAGAWWRRHALPWMWRRLQGRTAGDGRSAKHRDYVRVGRERDVAARSDA